MSASETPCATWGGIAPWMPEGHYTTIRCRRCGTDYVDSDVTEEYLDALQAAPRPDKVGVTTYEATDDLDAVRSAELAENWDMINRIRPAKPGDELLDFGSAWGAFGAAAMRDQVIPNGIELQPEGAAHSRKTWDRRSTIHEGPIETAPFENGRFQFVTSFETLEHVADPIRIMRHMARLTAPDGVVAVSMPSADYFAFKYWLYRGHPLSGWLRRRFPGNMQQGRVLIHNHLITPTVKSATMMMEQAGLEVIHAGIYCSGLSGGRLGKILKLVGKLLWPLSGHRIAFAPSVFVVGRPKAT